MEPYLTQPQLLRGVRDWFAIKKYWMKWRKLVRAESAPAPWGLGLRAVRLDKAMYMY